MSRQLRSRSIALLAAAGLMVASPALGAATLPRGVGEAAPAGTILYFNDAHEIGPVVTGGQDRGGVARLSTAIDSVRAADPGTAVVFGGDLAGGTIFGGLYKGFPMVEAFNRIGIDLANLGQHDFDFGVDNTRALIAASEFPWITSNLLEADGTPFLPGATWHVAQVGDLSVGYIGLTDGMETTSVGSAVIELDHVAAATAALADMEAAADPDVVVAVTQVPLATGEALVDALPQLDVVLLEEMAEYDSVVVEHGGAVLAAPEGNLGSLIRLDVTLGPDGEVTVTPSVVEVDHTVVPDAGLRELEEFYAAEMDANLSEVLATVETPLLNPDHATRRVETRLGSFVADAFRAFHSADVGWANGGGIRAEAPGPSFTLRDAYALAPFDNKVMLVEVSGADLRQALEDAVARVQDQGGGFPQVSGMAYSYDPAAPVGARIGDVRVAGQQLDDGATHTVAVTNYVVGGGDAVTGFTGSEVLVPAAEAPADAEAIAAYARELGTIAVELEGRIRVLGDEVPTTEPTTPAPAAGPTTAPAPTPPGTGGSDGDGSPASEPGTGTGTGSQLPATGAPSGALLALLGAVVVAVSGGLLLRFAAHPTR
ncbi:5'-nucleotidase C-terminal domain-containing protein [Georgenia sp. MJ206]|uniref:bifunctional metallophosphatase/5'-nucleotidase n=1 Tax=Georgenia wangjunii TaxID=3117730 RepID=UPI002F26413B